MRLQQSIPAADAVKAFEPCRTAATNPAFEKGLPIDAVRSAVSEVMHAQYFPKRASSPPQVDETGTPHRLLGANGSVEVYVGCATDIASQVMEKQARAAAIQGGRVRVNQTQSRGAGDMWTDGRGV